MKHLFVPYELALMLKEKGFDEECIGYYAYDYLNNKENALHLTDRPIKPSKFKQKYLGVPLYQQVIDFLHINLRKKIKEVIGITIYHDNSGFWSLGDSWEIQFSNLNEAIEEALKLI